MKFYSDMVVSGRASTEEEEEKGGEKEQRTALQATQKVGLLTQNPPLLPLAAAVVSSSWHKALPVWDQLPMRTALFYWLLRQCTHH